MIIFLICFLNFLYSLWYLSSKNQELNFSYHFGTFQKTFKDLPPEQTLVFFDSYYALNPFLCENFAKNFSYFFLQHTPLPKENENKVIIILEDDYQLQESKKSDNFYKKFLKKVIKILSLGNFKYSHPQKRNLSLKEKLEHFELPKEKLKLLKKEGPFFVFELKK